MGQALTKLILADETLELVGGLEPTGSEALGQDLGTLAGQAACGIIATDDALDAMRQADGVIDLDRKSTRLNSSHSQQSRMPSSA